LQNWIRVHNLSSAVYLLKSVDTDTENAAREVGSECQQSCVCVRACVCACVCVRVCPRAAHACCDMMDLCCCCRLMTASASGSTA
jgi:hypothetical protein